MKLFLSYHFDDETFVQRVNYYLLKQPDLRPYCYADEKHRENWVREIGSYLNDAEAFLLFMGNRVGETQLKEALIALSDATKPKAATQSSDEFSVTAEEKNQL